MNVCYVFQDEYPWDVRVEKICSSLIAHGIQAHIVARNRKGTPVLERLPDGITVHRLPAVEGSAALRDLLNFPAFVSPVWLAKIHQVVRSTRSEVIVVRDLPMSPAALIVGRRLGVPVVMDMAENYPAMWADTWNHRGRRGLDILLRNPATLRRLERAVVPRLDGVLVVSPQSADRVLTIGGRKETTWVVGNTPRLEAGASDAVPVPRASDQFRLMYVGGMEESRGLEVVVRAMALLAPSAPNARFVIAGRGPTEAKLRELAASLGIPDNIEFTGWVDPASVPSLIASADACIVPHFVTEHTTTTVPNKIFDYMLQARPVIVTDALTLREIVESCLCGLTYHDTDPRALADAILRLLPADYRRELGLAGRRAVLERYNWSQDEKVLIDAMRHFGFRS